MDKVRRVLNRAVPDAEKALASVNGLISDVMEVGSTSTTLIQEATSPGALIDSALSEIFRIYPQSNVSIDYDFQHTSMVKVHVDKIARVFSNIIGNALEAMDFRGRIWFQTKEYGEVIEFCLGNSGSIIPLESQPKLFEAFFTGGKKGGTGLGLAIAHKLVTAHGGRIWCESARTPEHPRGFVEFRFTLPSIKGVASTWLKVLPTHSRDVTSSLKLKTNGDDTSSESELHLVNAIAEASQAIGRPLRILLIDDEAVYCRVLIDQVLFSERLRDVCLIEQAANSSEVLALDSTNCDLVITDLDLGHDSRNGFDLVGDLRRQGLRGFVCIHSNRIVAEDHKCALDSGADAFLPKPMSRMHFLKLILQATQRAVALRSPVFKVTQDESTRTDLRKSIECRFADKNVGQEEVEPHDRAKVLDDGVKSVIVVDDDVFLLEAWRQVLTGFSVLTYARPADLFADIESGVVQAASTKAVVTDFHFENEPTITGAVLARRLAAKGFGRIVAATDAMIESDDRRLFVEVVTKDEIAFGFDVARVVG
jgi:DNA-binding NarL/FixJ family response regulator